MGALPFPHLPTCSPLPMVPMCAGCGRGAPVMDLTPSAHWGSLVWTWLQPKEPVSKTSVLFPPGPLPGLHRPVASWSVGDPCPLGVA